MIGFLKPQIDGLEGARSSQSPRVAMTRGIYGPDESVAPILEVETGTTTRRLHKNLTNSKLGMGHIFGQVIMELSHDKLFKSSS